MPQNVAFYDLLRYYVFYVKVIVSVDAIFSCCSVDEKHHDILSIPAVNCLKLRIPCLELASPTEQVCLIKNYN